MLDVERNELSGEKKSLVEDRSRNDFSISAYGHQPPKLFLTIGHNAYNSTRGHCYCVTGSIDREHVCYASENRRCGSTRLSTIADMSV